MNVRSLMKFKIVQKVENFFFFSQQALKMIQLDKDFIFTQINSFWWAGTNNEFTPKLNSTHSVDNIGTVEPGEEHAVKILSYLSSRHQAIQLK